MTHRYRGTLSLTLFLIVLLIVSTVLLALAVRNIDDYRHSAGIVRVSATSPEVIQSQTADCIGAHRTPHARVAYQCRRYGWTIQSHLVVGPHARVRYSTLPHCTVEDASSGPLPCSWNFTPGDGNSRGLAYWVGAKGHTHYVWAKGLPAGWQWVRSSLADALAEGTSVDRNWAHCQVKVGPTTVVRCPDGHREVS